MARVLSSDVARRAGVSRATVSYVLNARADKTISAQTRRRVLDAAAELGYVPSAAATALGSGRSRVVLLRDSGRVPAPGEDVLPLGSLFGQLRDALAREVQGWGMTLVSCGSYAPVGDVLGHVDPALVIAPEGLADDEAAVVAAVGAVLVDRDEQGAPLADLVLERVPRLQVEHMTARGYQRLAYLSTALPGPGPVVASRRRAVLQACERQGLATPPEHRASRLDEDAVEAAAAALRQWVALGVDAVVCFNDVHAGLAVAAARRAGLSVPGDLAVIGADDELLGRYTDPPLTTVAPDMVAFGRYLAARGRTLLDGTAPPPAPRGLVRVVERATAPGRSRSGPGV